MKRTSKTYESDEETKKIRQELAELDNLAFSHGLREKMRVEAEEFGRISVTDDDSRLIDAVKLVCVLTIPAVLLGGVALRGAEGASLSPLPSMVIVMVQSVWCAPAGNLPAGIFWAVLRALRGCCFFYGAALIVYLFLVRAIDALFPCP